MEVSAVLRVHKKDCWEAGISILFLQLLKMTDLYRSEDFFS